MPYPRQAAKSPGELTIGDLSLTIVELAIEPGQGDRPPGRLEGKGLGAALSGDRDQRAGGEAAVCPESLIPPLGPDGVRAQNPETRPRKIKKSSAPFFHVLRKKVRTALWEAYGAFFAAFREAAAQWRAGDRSAAFPIGRFPPGLPFVTA